MRKGREEESKLYLREGRSGVSQLRFPSLDGRERQLHWYHCTMRAFGNMKDGYSLWCGGGRGLEIAEEVMGS